MSRSCSVCSHIQAETINLELARRVPMRTIAEKYGVGLASLARHKQHMPQVQAEPPTVVPVGTGPLESILARIAELDGRLESIFDQAQTKNPALALRVLKECRENTALLARLAESITQAQPANMLAPTSPEWHAIRRVLLKTLEPYSDARKAVVAALEAFI